MDKADKETQKEIVYRHSKGKKDVLISKTYKTKNTLESYRDNLLKSFSHHYSKFPDYKDNCTKKIGDKINIELGFLLSVVLCCRM